jgi:hypothetical protein
MYIDNDNSLKSPADICVLRTSPHLLICINLERIEGYPIKITSVNQKKRKPNPKEWRKQKQTQNN